MKITELKIDNIVSFDNRTDCICIVSGLSKNKVDFNLHWIDEKGWPDEDLTEPIENITGIEITEEWLKYFGFSWDQITYYLGNHLMLAPSKELGYAVFYSTLTHGRIERNLKYVHELQNLYFELTETELQYKFEK